MIARMVVCGALLVSAVAGVDAAGNGERRRPAERDARSAASRGGQAGERPHWSDRGQHVPKFNERANPPKADVVKDVKSTGKGDPPPTPRPRPPSFKY